MRVQVLGVGLVLALSLTLQAQAPQPAPSSTAPNVPGAAAPGFPGRLPPRDPAATPVGTAILRGRTVRADTGQPLRRVQVRVSASELQEPRATMSDDDGRWEVKGLPAGRYQLGASKGGYVSLQYGQRRPFEQGRPVELRDGEVLEKVDFALPRGSVITGRVTDEAGEPVTGGTVQVARFRYFNGQRQMTPVAGLTQTDDRGEFRVFGIAPGDYYVSATLRAIVAFGQSDDRSGYTATYYPGTPSPGDAQRITVGLGQEVQGISFQLVPARTATLSGIARDAEGRPVSSGMVTVMQSPTSGVAVAMAGVAQLRPDGSFSIAGVAPGDYVLQARPMTNGVAVDVASAEVTVAGADISGIVLAASKSVVARGRITFDGGRPPAGILPEAVRILSIPPPGTLMAGPSTPATAKADWTFELEGQTGKRLLRASLLPGNAQPWTVKSVLLDGKDVTDTPLDFRDDIDGLTIVMTQQTTTLTGGVSDARGGKVTDATVVVFADDPQKWGPQTRFIRATRPDQEGRFAVRGLPPARYRIIALDYIEPREEGNPETLEQLRRSAAPVTLTDGESKTVDLKVVVGN